MATYTIELDNGDTHLVQADKAQYEVDAGLFTFHGTDKVVALVPARNVLLVKRLDEAVES